MQPILFHPDRRFQIKLYLQFTLILLAGLIGLGFIAILIGLKENGAAGALTGMIIVGLLNAVWYSIAMLLVSPYYHSLQYEIHEDEVIVRVGVITKTVKHVPFRTVTNLTVNRGPFDRLFGIGTLNIQTAGMSGQTGVEESLVGLPNYQAVYDQVAGTLRRFRGAMSPTQAEDEIPEGPALHQILAEVRAIRQVMEQATKEGDLDR